MLPPRSCGPACTATSSRALASQAGGVASASVPTYPRSPATTPGYETSCSATAGFERPWPPGRLGPRLLAPGGLAIERERMAAVVDLEQALDRQVRVALRGRQALMPQKLLDHPQIRPALQHVRRAHVAQRVGMQVRATQGLRPVSPHQVLYLAHT